MCKKDMTYDMIVSFAPAAHGIRNRAKRNPPEVQYICNIGSSRWTDPVGGFGGIWSSKPQIC